MIKTFIIKTNKDLDNRKNDISNQSLNNYYQLNIILKVFGDIKNSKYYIKHQYNMLCLNEDDLENEKMIIKNLFVI